ncbi:hypothetical protein IAU60_005433 [Kwoniella sp. DSM 27419]
MLGLLPLLPLLTLVAASPAVLERNLAYRSPYLSHPDLAIDTKQVYKRHLVAAEEIRLRKREQAIPEGKDSEYPQPGYGLGVTDWSNSDYIYSGPLNFTHSVASGDPFDYSVILWTRAVPADTYHIDIPQCVRYKVYQGDDANGEVVSEGWSLTGADVDWTVKFENCADASNKSPVGKTRTAPGKYAKDVSTQRFAIYSGFFSAYSGPVIHQDADYVVHLGDYIYEYGTGGVKINRVPSKGAELASLDDYRRRYDQYRTDVDLASMHQNLPIIAIWDDHETANNDWKAGSSNSNDSIATGGCAYSNGTVCFSDRAMHAKRAYFEWIPIRQVDLGDQARIWRDFRFGDLLDVYALDTRKYDRDITDLSYNVEYVQSLAKDMNSSRSIVGPQQEEWIERGLSESQARGTVWKLVMNQVILGSQKPDTATFITNYDVFTGDTHASWLFENNLETVLQGSNDSATLKELTPSADDYQRGTVVEFGGTAVSSSGWGASWGSYDNATVGAQRMVENNPTLLYSEGFREWLRSNALTPVRGYMTVSVNYTHLETSWYSYPGNQEARVPNNRTLAMRATMAAGANHVMRPLMQPVFGAVKPGFT